LIVRALDVLLMISIQLAFVADEWRKLHGSRVRSWLRVAGEMEALLSLAAYSYEHPADFFPDLSLEAQTSPASRSGRHP
jgi:hypothetical protein